MILGAGKGWLPQAGAVVCKAPSMTSISSSTSLENSPGAQP